MKRIKLKPAARRIFMQQWLSLKPYYKPTPSDTYYLNLCNEVKSTLSHRNSEIHVLPLTEKDINDLCCFLTAYFEDVISGTNLWNTFVRLHRKLYNKPLPFYETKEYYTGEINPGDIAFLIWYFVNCNYYRLGSKNGTPLAFFSHNSRFILPLANRVFDIFDREYEYAPENPYLESYYFIDENENDYYKVRYKMTNLLFHSYLFYFDTGVIMKNEINEAMDTYENDEDLKCYMGIESYIYEIIDNLTHSAVTHLLSMRANEWLAETLGSAHPLYHDLLNISKKIKGMFQYKEQDATHITLQHIASDKIFKVTKESIEHPSDFNEKNELIYIGLVRWKNEWWFSGNAIHSPFNADIILDEKNSIESRRSVDFLDYDNKKTKVILQKQMQAFLKFNNNSPIAFLPSDEIMPFMQKYINFYNDSLSLSEEEKKQSEQRLKSKGFFGGNEQDKKTYKYHQFKDAVVFFNPAVGIEYIYGIASAFPTKENPFYDPKQSEDDFKHICLSPEINKELCLYCLENYKDKFSFLSDEPWCSYMENLDFLLRFWKHKNYHSEPYVTIV